MRKSYNYTSSKSSNTAVKAATASVIIIILLAAVCVGELIALAVLNIRLESLKKDPPSDSEVIGALDTDADVSSEVDDQPDVIPASVQLAETADYGMEYIDKIIFVGDSTTNGMKSKAYHVLTGGTETKQVWTPQSGTLSLDPNIAKTLIYNPYSGTDMTIAEAAGQVKPEYMVLTVGLNNGVPFLDEGEFKLCYRKLIGAIAAASPNTKIILQSIYPVAANNTKESLTNEKIDRANGWIKDLAEEYNLKYLNTNPSLKDADGYLKMSYQNGDGIHLNRSGFEAVLNYIRTHGYPKS